MECELTVLFATHNGGDILRRTLEGYACLEDPGVPWKMVGVDNASTDNTGEIIDSFAGRLNIDHLYEETPGKNRALNKGLPHLEGEIIILTDDDSVPQAGFLDAWRRAFAKKPDADVFGGTILPEFDAKPPQWLVDNELKFEELYAVRRGVPEGPIEPLKIYGPNMAARACVFDDGFRFNEAIGPNGADANYAMGSENDFCMRAHRKGHLMWFSPEPIVHHIVRPHQITPDYFARRAYKLGRGAAQQQWSYGLLTYTKRSMLVRWVSLLRRELSRARHAMSVKAAKGEREQFDARWRYEFFCGYQAEHARRKQIAATQGEEAAAQG